MFNILVFLYNSGHDNSRVLYILNKLLGPSNRYVLQNPQNVLFSNNKLNTFFCFITYKKFKWKQNVDSKNTLHYVINIRIDVILRNFYSPG